MNKPVSLAVALLVIVGAFFLINHGLVTTQTQRHGDDQKRLDDITRQLDAERPQIDAKEHEVARLGKEVAESEARLRTLHEAIQLTERQHPAGIPLEVQAEYGKTVEDHNGLVEAHNAGVTRHRALYDAYTAQVDRYNALTDEGNALAQKIGGTWKRVPMPRLGGSPSPTTR